MLNQYVTELFAKDEVSISQFYYLSYFALRLGKLSTDNALLAEQFLTNNRERYLQQTRKDLENTKLKSSE